MFAVIRTGGKQYKVSKSDRLQIPKLAVKEGDSVDLDVMMTSDGKKVETTPGKAKVSAKVLSHIRAPKITVFKKKRRQNYRRTKGHRQDLTIVEIIDIKAA